MTTPSYPESLPGVSGYSHSPTGQLVGGDEEDGPRAVRHLTRHPGALAELTWQFFQNEYSVFYDWWKNDLIRGHKWFYITLPCAAGFKQHVVQFAAHYQMQIAGHKYWRVTAQVYVRERKIDDEIFDLYFTSETYPILVQDSADVSLAAIALSLTTPVLLGNEDAQMSIVVQALTLVSLLKTIDLVDESEISIDVVDVTMATVRKEIELDVENFINAIQVVNITMEALRINQPLDTDETGVAMTVVGVTLV